MFQCFWPNCENQTEGMHCHEHAMQYGEEMARRGLISYDTLHAIAYSEEEGGSNGCTEDSDC